MYAYKCTSCNMEIDSRERLALDKVPHGHREDGTADLIGFTRCGPLKRIWSVGIVWPMSERGH